MQTSEPRPPRADAPLLTLATLGMVGYGLWAAAGAAADLVGPRVLEFWANLAAFVFGLILLLAAALVRVRMPGGLALAIGALLGLQALALHAATHYAGANTLTWHLTRAAFAGTLVLLGFLGNRRPRRRPESGSP